MIKYKETVGEATIELECQTIGELIEYLNSDKEKIRIVLEADRLVVKSNDSLVWNGGEYWPKTPQFFIRPDNSVHFPKIEIINGELWFINDGQQPVGDDVKVDIKYKNNVVIKNIYGSSVNYDKDYVGPYKVTHWRLA